MMKYYQSRLASFRNAFAGIGYVLRTQKNSWIHAVVTIVVVILAFWLELPITHWGILVLAISGVWGTEIINTAIESLIDLLSPEFHPIAKIGKDVSAGAVLLSAFCSIILGLLIFGPPLVHKFLLLAIAWRK